MNPKTPSTLPETCTGLAAPTDMAPPAAQRRALLRGVGAGLLGAVNLSLLGCGGGGGEEATTTSNTNAGGVKFALGGIDGGGTGMSANVFISAAVDTTAPLTVNGTTLDTSGAAVTDAEGNTLPAHQLHPGMSCEIEALAPRTAPGQGTAAPLQALRIRSAEQLLAPVQTVDVAGNGLVALGQRVVVTAGTVFGGSLQQGLAQLQPGALLRVWGQLDTAGGRIVATRVEEVADAGYRVVRGVLTALDNHTGSLAVGALQLDTGAAVQVPQGLKPGDVVRLRLAADGATVLSLAEDALKVPERVQAEVEGRVTRVDSAKRFAVDGVEIDAAAATWQPAATLLRPGQQVTVRGRQGGGGALQASSVSVEADELVDVQGTISSANAVQRSFVLKGVTVVWSASTRFEGGTARLLAPRRRVQVLGRWSSDGKQLEAVRIHVEA